MIRSASIVPDQEGNPILQCIIDYSDTCPHCNKAFGNAHTDYKRLEKKDLLRFIAMAVELLEEP